LLNVRVKVNPYNGSSTGVASVAGKTVAEGVTGAGEMEQVRMEEKSEMEIKRHVKVHTDNEHQAKAVVH
jgi:hypothetical protein